MHSILLFAEALLSLGSRSRDRLEIGFARVMTQANSLAGTKMRAVETGTQRTANTTSPLCRAPAAML